MVKGIPRPGARIVKSAAAVAVCLLFSQLFPSEGMRIYASIAALWCIRTYNIDAKKMAVQRITGTAVGSVYGALTIALEIYALGIQGTWQGYVLEAVFVAAVLYTTVVLNIKNASYFSCVVYLSIVVAHITDSSPWLFVWQRIFETLVGIAVGMLINAVRIPRKKRTDTLFVSGVDDVLLDEKGALTPYSRAHLNRMVDDGALFSLVTMRTPASVRESTDGLRLKLPIVVMDGAALYDMNKKRYISACILPKNLVLECCALLDKHGINYFLNGLLDDVLMIYYDRLENEAEKDIYARMHTSPYRNYVSRKYYSQCSIIYIMAVAETQRLQAAADALEQSGLGEKIKYRFYPSTDYPGFSYLKIYEKSASRTRMLSELQKSVGAAKMTTLGSVPGLYDVVLNGEEPDRVARRLERMFEPYFWENT